MYLSFQQLFMYSLLNRILKQIFKIITRSKHYFSNCLIAKTIIASFLSIFYVKAFSYTLTVLRSKVC